MEVMDKVIFPLSSMASLLIALVVFIEYVRRQLESYKKSKEDQQKRHEDLRSHIRALTGKATTSAKRQDISIYINEALGNTRHLELVLRTKATSMYIAGFIMLVLSVMTIFFTKHNVWLLVPMVIFNIMALFNLYKISQIVKYLGDKESAMSGGYLEALHAHMDKVVK